MDKYQEAFKKILKLIVSGKIPKELYNEYLGDTEIGFMSFEELETYFSEPQPTLSECIKEWEEEGFNVREENNYIYITPKDKVRNEKIMIRLLFKDVYPNAFLTSKQLELLSKTLKALEVK